jgi:hypothetical protein
MNPTSRLRKSASTLILALTGASSAHAAITPVAPPVPFQWRCIADTCTVAVGPCAAPAPLTRFVNFNPPVMPQYDAPLAAFKAWIQPGTLTTGLVVNASNDEGVWSNGPGWASGSFTMLTNNILREGDPVPSSGTTFGVSNALTVQNLQMGAGGVTMCTTNTSAAAGKVAVLENCCLQNLGESPTSALMDIRPPVIDMANRNIGMWKRAVGGVSGVEHGGLPGFIMPPCIPPVNAWWSGFSPGWAPNQIARVGSPSISEQGTIALYGRDNFIPAAQRNHIRVVDPAGTPAVVVRQGWGCPPVPGLLPPLSRFGIIHSQLQANSDDRTLTSAPTDLVAWQMDTMTAPGPVTMNQDTLWCKQSGVYNCLAYQTQNAPFIPGRTVTGFYALHAIAQQGITNSSHVVWGVRLSPGPGLYAIYTSLVTGGVMGPVDLIATDVPGITPVNTLVAGVQNITTLAPFFSVNARGDVLFKATCAAAPVGQRQILVTASAAAGHARSVRAQSSLALPTLNCGMAVATNFQLATPEQGTYSRGQALNGLKQAAAKILFNAPAPAGSGQGIFIGF